MILNDSFRYRGYSMTELDDMINAYKMGHTAMPKRVYTWEQKIDSLVKLAKAAGRYINSGETEVYSPSTRSDYYHDARQKFRDAYEEFCQWRHDEPYVVDEIMHLLEGNK